MVLAVNLSTFSQPCQAFDSGNRHFRRIKPSTTSLAVGETAKQHMPRRRRASNKGTSTTADTTLDSSQIYALQAAQLSSAEKNTDSIADSNTPLQHPPRVGTFLGGTHASHGKNILNTTPQSSQKANSTSTLASNKKTGLPSIHRSDSTNGDGYQSTIARSDANGDSTVHTESQQDSPNTYRRTTISDDNIVATLERILNPSGSQHIKDEGVRSSRRPQFQLPVPGTILIDPEQTSEHKWRDIPTTVRVATELDDFGVALLRIMAFPDLPKDLERNFFDRCRMALATRRDLGATCIVATLPNYDVDADHPHKEYIVGTAECSFHEFEGTKLGRKRQIESMLYITEVVVRTTTRRKGIGKKLLMVRKNCLLYSSSLVSQLTHYITVLGTSSTDARSGNNVSTCGCYQCWCVGPL